MSKHKYTFIEFVGSAWIYGKAVAAYKKQDGSVQLRAETTGGKIIRSKNCSEQQYEELRREFYAGCFEGDASVSMRALEYMLPQR